MKFYDFLDQAPPIGKLVVIEGTERALADRALEVIVDRLLPETMRDLNFTRFLSETLTDAVEVSEALQAMPFLAERRVVAVTDTQTMRAAPRRELWAVAQNAPEGNTLVLVDLLSPSTKTPQRFGALAGRTALRIDTTAGEDARARFVGETLAQLGAKADPRATYALARSTADLAAVRNDLEKLALSSKKITFDQLEREALTIEDPKAYKYAHALVAGRTAEALAIAHESMANNPRNAAMSLLSNLATACLCLWELARRGGSLPEREHWRERILRPLAARAGERRARAAYERVVAAIEAIVTGRAGSDPADHRTLVDRISVELSKIAR